MVGSSWQASRRVAARMALGALAATFLALACGQEDPTFRPDGGGSVEKGAIDVSSSVPGARISLDGVDTGRITPDTLDAVDPGTHRVSVLLAGFYPPAEQTVDVVANQVHSLAFELAQIPTVGRISVTAPYPAGILYDGIATGLACPDTVEGVAPGAHSVTIVLPGFASDPASIQVDVVGGRDGHCRLRDARSQARRLRGLLELRLHPLPARRCGAAACGGRGRARARYHGQSPHFLPGARGSLLSVQHRRQSRPHLLQSGQVAPTILVDGVRVPQIEVESSAAIRARIEAALRSRRRSRWAVAGRAHGDDLRGDRRRVGDRERHSFQSSALRVGGRRRCDPRPAGPNGQSHYTNVLRHLYPTPSSADRTAGSRSAPSPRASGGRTHSAYDLPPGDDVERPGAQSGGLRSRTER